MTPYLTCLASYTRLTTCLPSSWGEWRGIYAAILIGSAVALLATAYLQRRRLP